MYDSAPVEVFERVRAYVGFTGEDSRLLAAFLRHVQPRIATIVEDFYDRIRRDPRAAKVITGGEAQIARLKETQREWLTSLLRGPHDDDFAERQAAIGRRHVKVGLEMSYMISGVDVFREHLNAVIFESLVRDPARAQSTQRAVARVLDIVLAIMLETYHQDYHRKLMQSEQNATMRRLASLGEVAASIAHEIRNPLAGISGAIQVFSADMPKSDSRQEILRDVLREIGRMDERVNDLLLYARPAYVSREEIRPAELLKTTVRVLSEDPSFRRIKVRIDAPRALPAFPLDAGQIQQVLVNLILNGVQAMNGSGEIRLEASVDEAGLALAVEDNGPGIPAEDAERIFQPFFTTRSHGTGLGLAISRKIVESHGGWLEAVAAGGGGARFVISLPWPAGEPASHPLVG